MAFYHTYRPKKFTDLIGQDHVRTTLQNALATHQVGQAYLFAGPKGSGKTTTARLLARAVNCVAVDSRQSTVHGGKISSVDRSPSSEIEPCNACEICQDILDGRSMDVIEIDAASNRGIDEIRQLRDGLNYRPVKAAKKVYIIDEVHMLTREAFNALLKSLEEPFGHVLFIFATTEPHRIPETILSRVQRFDFRRASQPILVDWLKTIAQSENIQLDDAALGLIANRSGGAFRDAAVLLEQLAATGQTPITVADCQAILGLADQETIDNLINLTIDQGEAKQVLLILDQLYTQGIDVAELTNQLIDALRVRLRRGASSTVVTGLEELLKAKSTMRFSPVPQLPLELAMINLSQSVKPMPDLRPPVGRAGTTPEVKEILHQSSKTVDREPASPKLPAGDEPVDITANGQAQASSLDQVTWSTIVNNLKTYNHSLTGILRSSTVVEPDSSTIKIIVPYKFHQKIINHPKNLTAIEQQTTQVLGRPVKVECEIGGQLTNQSVKAEDEIALANAAEEIFG